MVAVQYLLIQPVYLTHPELSWPQYENSVTYLRNVDGIDEVS